MSPLTQNGAPRPRVALVHDYLNQYGGAERVIEALHELFPEAPVFTSLYDPAAMPARYRTWDIRTSFLQRIPAARRFHRSLLLLYPMAFEAFDLRQFDVVISNSSAWAKSVITGPATTHICYCLTPMRWAWNYAEYVEREGLGKATRAVLPAAIHYLRLWDVATAKRVDRFVGISRAVVARIGKYYGRAADLIPPPVDVADAELSTSHSDQFLVVSRLIPYKRIDLAVAACSRLGLPLTVIGDGRDRARLEALAGDSVRFTGRMPDAEVRRAFAGCGAFVFPGEEDFGIAPVEAMAAGRPVVAFAGGGALDTVVEGLSGRFFREQTVESLCATLSEFDSNAFDPAAIRAHAMQFDKSAFQESIRRVVARATAEGGRIAAGEPSSV
ncbi:MAG TPA: glycosyltransferase [Chloroflexota bacterium]|nr:glycosyltransferase [Chloroflexota bacterium]